MFTILFYLLAFVGIWTTILAISAQSQKMYGLAGLFWFGASVLGMFSIGIYLLLLPFILWTLALAHMFGWVHSRWGTVLFITIGAALWMVFALTLG
ncbi:hypothetical protein [Paenibacillus piri]|uniref:Uncharacterized protein n=1 Tax=Paenibacillus piri TaxID=2547395 RepID=A0A4V2ZT74_9BACL|nr:hypothetical protein [Paenibacillus piri]TDF95824.1 hypothetical protein E1757_19005 [Paenibacillus piri]